MPQITAWMCPRTDQLFASKEDYRQHLARLARKRRDKRRHQAFVKSIDDQLAAMRNDCNSYEDIARFIEEHPALFRRSRYMAPDPAKFTITDVKFTDMIFLKSVSITHSAPIGKPTNWGCKPGLPTGYPGCTGRILFNVPSETDYSYCFAGTGVNTGGGGGGYGSARRFAFEVRLYMDDWKFILRDETFKKLAAPW